MSNSTALAMHQQKLQHFMSLVDALAVDAIDDLSVQCESVGGPFWFALRDGFVEVGDGPFPGEADLMLRSSVDRILETLLREFTGWRAAHSTLVCFSGELWTPMTPFDVGPQAQPSLPIPGQTLTVQHAKSASPVGTIEYYDVFIDGRFASRQGGRAERADVRVSNTFERMILANDRSLDFLDSISGIQIDCEDPVVLMLMGGFYEASDLREHLGQRHEINKRVRRLASLCNHPSWQKRVSLG